MCQGLPHVGWYEYLRDEIVAIFHGVLRTEEQVDIYKKRMNNNARVELAISLTSDEMPLFGLVIFPLHALLETNGKLQHHEMKGFFLFLF